MARRRASSLVKTAAATRPDAGEPLDLPGRRRPPLADVLRRLQALLRRGLPRRLPDRRAVPHRVRHGRRSGGRLQRLRLLRAGLPVRRARPARGRRAGLEVHALLRPPEGRQGAGLRAGVPDRLDPVRRARRPARARRRAARAARERGRTSAPVRRRPDDGVGGLGAFFLLLDEPEAYALPPDPVATTRDLADLGGGRRGRGHAGRRHRGGGLRRRRR